MDIIISKDERKDYEKLKITTQLTLVKEKLRLFENKYNCSLDEFSKKMEKTEEKFEEWDDYIEWKANFEISKDLESKSAEIDNGINIKVI